MAIILLGIILIVFILVQSVRFVGRIGSDIPDSDAADATLTLPEYARLDSSVSLTYSGPIEAREDYQQIKMLVSADQRRLEIIDGYGNRVVRRQALDNDTLAYGTFLRALELNGFMDEQDNQLGDDERGVCYKGKRIVIELMASGQSLHRLWAASCDKDFGNLAGSYRDILKLFQWQFPSYDDFTDNVDF